MTTDISFGKLIKRRRAALGMSQAALADLVGRSASAIRTWERGASTPTDEGVVRSLAAVLGVDESELRLTVGMPAEVRPQGPEEIGGRGLVEFTEEHFPISDHPLTSVAPDRPETDESADEVGAVTSSQVPDDGDESARGADEISWDDVAASVLRHTEPASPARETEADRPEVNRREGVALTDEVDEAEPESPVLSEAMVTEKVAREEPTAAAGEPEAVAGEDEVAALAEEAEPVTLAEEPSALAGEGELDGAAGELDAADRERELEDVAPEPETVSAVATDRPRPPAPEPLASAATTATSRTTVMSVREPVAPPAAGSYLDDPDQMMTYRIRAALTVALVMFLLVVLFWALGKLGDSISAVWDLFKAGA